MWARFYLSISRKARQMSTNRKVKLNVKMDEDTYKMIENEELKPRKHPGRMCTRLLELPQWLVAAVQKALQDMPITSILADSTKLANFLNGRHPPCEQSVIETKYAEIKEKVAEQRIIQNMAKKSIESEEEYNKKQSLRILKQTIHAWSPVNYNKYAGLLYLVSRSSKEYAVICQIFHEISTRDKDFQPMSLLDFGSGVGTVLWASSHFWPGAIQEHMCIESSTEMSDLSESIIEDSHPKINKVFHRHYIPLSSRTYDIVVSAYTLLELPNMKTRLDNIAKLWKKTQRYLIIIEQGTNAGFRMVNEAREFILHIERQQKQTDIQNNHIFSPCPHELRCPRYAKDHTPCNFEVRCNVFKLKNKSKPEIERFSYVVFKKGKSDDETKNWPRIVRPTLNRSKHTICRICTADGNLDEIIFTPTKHGKLMYRCAKSSKWGDRLPVETLIESTNEDQQNQQDEEAKEDVTENHKHDNK